jgi:hypothetical protein
MDRGFLEFERLFRFHEEGSFFITRRGPQQWPALRLERQWPSMAHRESGEEEFNLSRDKSHLFRVFEPFL